MNIFHFCSFYFISFTYFMDIFHVFLQAFDSVATTVMSFAIGFVVSVCVERPMFSLKNMLFMNERL